MGWVSEGVTGKVGGMVSYADATGRGAQGVGCAEGARTREGAMHRVAAWVITRVCTV